MLALRELLVARGEASSAGRERRIGARAVADRAAEAVIWHDLECGAYRADLALWRELCRAALRIGAPILDLGAGTGRVTLDLARAGPAR